MDEFYIKRLGILILAIMGLFAYPFGVLMGNLGLPPEWMTFILGSYGAMALFCEEVVRYKFKVPKEENTTSTESTDPPQ